MIMLRKRFVLLALVLAGLLHCGIRQATSRSRSSRIEDAVFARDDVTRYRTYVVGNDKWLEFQLPPQATALRLFTNAGLLSAETPTSTLQSAIDRIGYEYGVEYALLDRRGHPLETHVYHFRAPALRSAQAGHDADTFVSCFHGNALLPAGTRTMQLKLLEHSSPPDRLRIRLAKTDANVGEVVARLYTRQERAGYDKPGLWHRLPEKQRAKLTQASVFEGSLLSAKEKINLLRWRWASAAPIGMENTDYITRRMYVVDEAPDILSPDSYLGRCDAGPDHRVIVPLPDEAGQAAVQLRADPARDPNLHGAVEIQWYGKSPFDRQSFSTSLDASPITFVPPTPGGILDLGSSERVGVQVRWDSRESAEDGAESFPADITPLPRSLRMYSVSQARPVEYSIAHIKNQPTPFRITLRRGLDNDGSAFNSTEIPVAAKWQFVSDTGEIVDKGECVGPQLVSTYDRLSLNSHHFAVTDPLKCYFQVPTNVAKVRILPSDDAKTDCAYSLLVAAHTRPKDLPRRVLVPDEYLPINKGQSLNRSWFSLQPDEAAARIAEALSISCHFQSRPPKENESLITGDFQWESFVPRETAFSREFLTPRSPSIHSREEALASSFVEVSNGDSHTGRWRRAPGKRWIEPRMIYQVADDGEPHPIVQISINGEVWFQQTLNARSGEIRLPKVASNNANVSNEIQFQSSNGVRMFVNRLDIEPSDAIQPYLKRLAHQLRPTMHFVYPKRTADQELLMLRVFREGDDSLTLKARVDGSERANRGGPTTATTSYSLTNWEFVIESSPDQIKNSVALGARRHAHGDGELCFIRLGEDVPIGEYTIHVQSTGPGYVMVYRSLPGRKEKRSLFLEHVE